MRPLMMPFRRSLLKDVLKHSPIHLICRDIPEWELWAVVFWDSKDVSGVTLELALSSHSSQHSCLHSNDTNK